MEAHQVWASLHPGNSALRTYTKGFYLRIPVLYDIEVGTKAHETRKLDSFEVDDTEGVQYTIRPSVTYRTIPDAKALYRSREYSQNVDVTIMEIAEDAISRVVGENPQAKLSVEAMTMRVHDECWRRFRTYGQELVRVNMPLPARSGPQKISEGAGALFSLLSGERISSDV